MMATAAAIVVLVAVVAAVTLLPALLGFAGNAIDKLSVHRRRKPVDEFDRQEDHVVPMGPRGGAASRGGTSWARPWCWSSSRSRCSR